MTPRRKETLADRLWHGLYRVGLAVADAVATPVRWLRGPWVAPDPYDHLPALAVGTGGPLVPVPGAAHGDPSYLEVWDMTGPGVPRCVGYVVDFEDATAMVEHVLGPGRYRVRAQSFDGMPGRFVGPVILHAGEGAEVSSLA